MKREYKYHYLYKITNKLTDQFYIGIHSTNNLNDNYMGSGTLLKRDYKIYGRDNFTKEIIKFFDNRSDLIKYEQEIINEELLRDPLCINITKGGIAGLEQGFTVGMVTVRDKDGNCFDVKRNDPRYISGELVSVNKNLVTVKDKFGKIFKVHVKDPRYISGELVIISKGNKAGTGRTYIMRGGESKSILKDELQKYLDEGWERARITKPLLNTICVTKEGEKEKFIEPSELQKYLDEGWEKKGKSRNKNKVTVFDPTLQKFIQVDKENPRYISGELKTKLQIQNYNAKNTKYMNKSGVVKRVKLENIDKYLDEGWELGLKSKL